MDFPAPLVRGIILTALIGGFGLNLVADYLNLANLKTEPPDEFKSLYDRGRYKQSQAYLRDNTRLDIITAAFDLLLILLFWFFKGFNHLDTWARTFGAGPVLTGLIFIGILIFVRFLLELPFSAWSTFIIEARYGFNRTTVRTFVLDRIKSAGLVVIIGGPLLASVLALLTHGGDWAWLACWAGTGVFLVLVQYIVPTWIMPLFNRFTPLETGHLRQAIMDYARSIDFSLDNIFIMDGSKRSTKANAFFTGFGRHKRIVLYDTLIHEHTPEELLAVLAHEMGHYKKKHIFRRMAAGIIQMGIVFWLVSVFISSPGLFNAFYMAHASVYAGLVFFGLLFTPIDLVISILLQMQSRKDEFEADAFATNTTGNGQALIDALKKLSARNLSNLTPHGFHVFLNYSHPPLIKRIAAIKRMEPGTTS